MSVKRVIIFIIILISIAVLLVLKTLINAGHFKKITAHSFYSCRAVTGIPGPEDIVVDRRSGTVLISFTDRRAAMRGEHPRGGICAYSTNIPHARPVLLTGDFKRPFTPHGISLYEGTDGTRLLFAINMEWTVTFLNPQVPAL